RHLRQPLSSCARRSLLAGLEGRHGPQNGPGDVRRTSVLRPPDPGGRFGGGRLHKSGLAGSPARAGAARVGMLGFGHRVESGCYWLILVAAAGIEPATLAL